jgi:beta-N-acetylhexosaminidase
MSTDLSRDIGQLFFIGLEGPVLGAHEADFIVKNNIGGVTLFGRNLKTPLELHKLCTDLHNLKTKLPSKAPLFIAIDMEGGRVHRLKAPFTQWPSLGKVAKLDSTSVAFKFANLMGLELRAMGINLDFAPCVDILTNPKNVLIGDRSLGTDPEFVAKMASALVRGYIKAGVVACAKHFPGHGNTIIDSHEDLPIEDVDMATLESRELIPFKKAFRARMDMVMTAHIKYKNIDPEHPATLSPLIIKKLLRENLRYKNIIISDDLDMKALTKNYSREEIPVLAMQAGCDVMLYCNEFDSPPIGLEAIRKAIKDNKIPAAQVAESLKRVADLKQEALADCAPLPLAEATKVIGHPDHLRLAKAINEGNVPEDLKMT